MDAIFPKGERQRTTCMKDIEAFVKQVDKAIDQLQDICTGIDNWSHVLTPDEIKEDIEVNALNNLIKSSYTMHRKMEEAMKND